jgi:outer membrane protein OmpA-like peptidoglycan-associated protein
LFEAENNFKKRKSRFEKIKKDIAGAREQLNVINRVSAGQLKAPENGAAVTAPKSLDVTVKVDAKIEKIEEIKNAIAREEIRILSAAKYAGSEGVVFASLSENLSGLGAQMEKLDSVKAGLLEKREASKSKIVRTEELFDFESDIMEGRLEVELIAEKTEELRKLSGAKEINAPAQADEVIKQLEEVEKLRLDTLKNRSGLCALENSLEKAGKKAETDKSGLKGSLLKKKEEINTVITGIDNASAELDRVQLQIRKQMASMLSAGLKPVKNITEPVKDIEAFRGKISGFIDSSKKTFEEGSILVKDAAVNAIQKDENIRMLEKGRDILITLPEAAIVFDMGKADLKLDFFKGLRKVADLFRVYPDCLVIIEGHTCDLGDEADNKKLSKKRADMVAMCFVENEKFPAGKFTTVGMGESNPVVPNTDEASRAKNRRVEIKIRKP